MSGEHLPIATASRRLWFGWSSCNPEVRTSALSEGAFAILFGRAEEIEGVGTSLHSSLCTFFDRIISWGIACLSERSASADRTNFNVPASMMPISPINFLVNFLLCGHFRRTSNQIHITFAFSDARLTLPISGTVAALCAFVGCRAILLLPRLAILSDHAILELVVENGIAFCCACVAISTISEMARGGDVSCPFCLAFCPAACPAAFQLCW